MGGTIIHSRDCMCLKIIFITKVPNISFIFLCQKIMSIDVNQMDGDIVKQHVAPENEKAKEMLDRIVQEELWMSAQELYLRGLVQEIKRLQDTQEKGYEEKLLKYYKEIDNICWFSKDKRDVKIETKLRSASDIFNSTSLN